MFVGFGTAVACRASRRLYLAIVKAVVVSADAVALHQRVADAFFRITH